MAWRIFWVFAVAIASGFTVIDSGWERAFDIFIALFNAMLLIVDATPVSRPKNI